MGGFDFGDFLFYGASTHFLFYEVRAPALVLGLIFGVEA